MGVSLALRLLCIASFILCVRDVTRLCSFDDYDCGYAASRTGSLNWEWKSLGRATSSFGKQPDNDHTLGTSVGT
ncbi:hypothetical protein AVEN_213938-1 [Araneus ventricosus]|uniref:MAM domain-containing protein n=2 Tax=Araneus ventricosus TaxID=182803 RepID=A0A4Y2D9T9_ARAVE|nr:hypothetical protein AVEN_244421-1 [Araneus ventricosus]GBM13134.1 hypothetical protein AVEN_213938-1 [Araneus ventricosus]